MKQILLLLAVCISSTLFSQNQWNFIGSYDIGSVYAMHNAEHFIYRESAFEIRITSDGDQTFITSNASPGFTTPFLKGFFLDENILMMTQLESAGYIKLVKSTNGGLDFTDVGSINLPEGYLYASFYSIHFFNEMTGVIHLKTLLDGDPIDLIIKTENGGASWELAADPEFSNNTHQLDYLDDQSLVLFRNSDVQKSTDLGETWTQLGSHPVTAFANCTAQGDNIWAVGDGGSQNPCNAISTDGGATFTEWAIPDFASGGFDDCGEYVASTGPGSLVVTGHENGFQNEVTLYSTDGGQTFSAIEFPDDEDHSAEVLYTTDDGNTYIYQSWEWYYAFTPGQSPNSVSENTLTPSITAYPNPSEDGTIHFSTSLDGITVYSQTGQEVFNSRELLNSIHLTDIESGVYYAKSGTQHFTLILN